MAEVQRISSGIEAFDHLLGGGWVPGCVYRLSGPPGCGKSTLALDVASRLPSLYAAAEEAASSVRMRFARICGDAPKTMLIGEVAAVEDVLDAPDGVQLVVVDSLHRLRSPAVSGAAGTNGQLVHATEELVGLARKRGVVVLAISHVNREGDASGTTGVDHDVDALIEMTRGEEDGELAILRIRKNRHGPAPIAVEVTVGAWGLRYHSEVGPAKDGPEARLTGHPETAHSFPDP
ncbi:MAG: AAA family ATPase [Deltaproteobacteria bacterium]|nr:AAA family ATPase [Deltaproteobacteria bacterium]